MRWLAAAIQVAQRRYKLTNLLLLLLRCLIMLLAALALARPSLAGLGRGGKLVLVVDASASMGARGNDPGPLAEVRAALTKAALPRRVSVLTVADRPRLIASGNDQEALAALERLAAEPLPGGLDRAAEETQVESVLAECGVDADVVLISDFQQDDGERLVARLRPRCRSVVRWVVGAPASNALVTGLGAMPDLVPNQPGELLFTRQGRGDGVRLSVDGGPATPALATVGGDRVRLALPPLEAGRHRLVVELVDGGLAYDNRLELDLLVRPQVATLIVQDQVDYLGAALTADTQQLANRVRRAADLAAAAELPTGGLLALRSRVPVGAAIATWVRAGGVLWADLGMLADDAQLKELAAGVALGERLVAGGALASGDPEIDEVLSLAGIDRLAEPQLPPTAEVLLRAGTVPVVAALPVGRGWVIVELANLAAHREFEARGTTPLWVRRTVRAYTARADQARLWIAGQAPPITLPLVLRRAGAVATAHADEPLRIAPGLWQAESGPAVVMLPNPDEGRLERRPPAAAKTTAELPLPQAAGADWGLPLLVAALLVLIGEGLLAAWAGKTYGR